MHLLVYLFIYLFTECIELITLTADWLGKACRKQRDGWGKQKGGDGLQARERVVWFVGVCAAYKSLLCVCSVESQQRDQGLTSLWWQLLATFKKTNQFGFPVQQSRAVLPMTPQNIQLLGSADGGWRAPRDGL